ncbi:MAG: hypothetical protein ACXWMH_12320 [Syntrophales bacterium]
MLERRRAIYIQLLGAFLAVAFLMLQGCGGDKKLDFKTEYQAVLLGDGQVYYGRVDKIERDFLVLSDVYYIQRNPASGAGEGQPIMVKRGKEPHGPDISYINTKFIVMVEPVKPDSVVANTIYEIKQKMAGSAK